MDITRFLIKEDKKNISNIQKILNSLVPIYQKKKITLDEYVKLTNFIKNNCSITKFNSVSQIFAKINDTIFWKIFNKSFSLNLKENKVIIEIILLYDWSSSQISAIVKLI